MSVSGNRKADVPLYEFKCEKCGHEFDRIQKVGDPAPPCPNSLENPVFEAGFGNPVPVDKVVGKACGAPTRRLVSRSTFQLKGSGWAADGY